MCARGSACLPASAAISNSSTLSPPGCWYVAAFLDEQVHVYNDATPLTVRAVLLRCVVQRSNSGHQLLLQPANWCPIFALPDHAGCCTS